MIGVVWFLLIVILVISQLSQARSKTTLKGRPFESRPLPGKNVDGSRKEAVSRLSSVSSKREEVVRDSAPRETARGWAAVAPPSSVSGAEEQTVSHPDLRSVVVWSEIIGSPLAKRKGRV